MYFKKLLIILMFFFIKNSAFAFVENNCVAINKALLSNYFKGLSTVQQIDDFFECIDNVIQFTLNHTETGDPNFYTQRELRHLMQYLGSTPARANEISQSFLDIKESLINGGNKRITLKEIVKIRKMFRVIQNRMKNMNSHVPQLIKVLNHQTLNRQVMARALNAMENNLTTLGQELSQSSVMTNLSLLINLPPKLNQLGLSTEGLKYWRPLILLISQWKKIFSGPPENLIKTNEWPVLLNSFGQVIRMWFYYKNFLENTVWMGVSKVQHFQHFLYLFLNLIKEANNQTNGIYLKDIEELARRVWFTPFFSTPVFSLALRSMHCFLIKRLTNNKACKYNIDFKRNPIEVVLEFPNRSYIIDNKNNIHIQSTGTDTEKLNSSHIDILFDYLRSWTGTELKLRKEKKLRSIFGSPHLWMNRNIGVNNGIRRHLMFQSQARHNQPDIPLMSYLNWHVHLTHLLVSAYHNNRSGILNWENWFTLVQEWTPLVVSIYKHINWQGFQASAFNFFSHGDLLTSQANGDNQLQPEESLELMTIASSSINMMISNIDRFNRCKIKNTDYYFQPNCIWRLFQTSSTKIFSGFPDLQRWWTRKSENKEQYINYIKEFYLMEQLSIGNLFEIYILIHYQENILEFLDKDLSGSLNLDEITPFYNTIQNKLKQVIPLTENQEVGLAFFTYLMHFGEIPVLDPAHSLSAPVDFSNWLLNPQKWHSLKVDRKRMFFVLNLIHEHVN